MHVAVDLRLLDRSGMERSGVGRAALESALALARARPTWRFTLNSNRPELFTPGENVEVERTRWPTGTAVGRIAWLHLRAGVTPRPRPDVWVGPAFVLPPRWRGPSVVTVHDLVFMLDPRRYRGRLNAGYAERATRRSVAQADRVLCPSPAMRDLVVERLGVPARKALAVPWGVGEALRLGEDLPCRGYALAVGRWEARKGLEVLGEALRIAAGRGRRIPLVLAGGPGWKAGAAVATLRARAELEVVEDPSDERLARLYGHALALVYPSRMEGFGLPVAEAMACGCPVIASDLPEIRSWAGDAPRYVPAGDAAQLAEALVSLASEPERQQLMARRGRAIASALTWEAYGATVSELIAEVAAGRSADPR